MNDEATEESDDMFSPGTRAWIDETQRAIGAPIIVSFRLDRNGNCAGIEVMRAKMVTRIEADLP